MSWNMWHIYGIGFDLQSADLKKYRNFILTHAESLLKAVEMYPGSPMREPEDLIRYLMEEDDPDYETMADLSENNILSAAISAILSYETGIEFGSPGIGDDSQDCVLFQATMPWQYNDTEKALTKEGLISLLDPYAKELGVMVDDDLDVIFSG